MSPTPVDVGALVDGIRAGRRAAVAQAITLVESSRREHRLAARDLLSALVAAPARPTRPTRPTPPTPPTPSPGPLDSESSHSTPSPEPLDSESNGSGMPRGSETGVRSPAIRVGISGVPGVGKSTFIEALGSRLTAAGHRVGVLAVDPSSIRTGGSVLGDKTRMARLGADPRAFIRPSPAAGTLGGVARATVQAMTVLEAAGYDIVLVETVGVGQSEVTVAGMVDTFLFLALARTGDQLQGIKKGILEIADVVAVNKADGDRETEAKSAARELAGALRLVRGRGEWAPPVVTCSGLHDVGVEELWQQVLVHREHLGIDGLADKRARQQLDFTWALVRDELDQRLRHSGGVRAIRDEVRAAVLAGELPATVAADRLLAAYDEG
ncbi:methylmalonyl Co-A mutase-associated GTPase MeaB [Lapillicoccus sp.]|uniref:methylmalonyl Co-A mutase-associated GTPase MeaB n=1 Tax=Lapillicoccus sp. TaxID=1909287 RepID=UPI0025D672F0|nr:methylmalonyl Co-A mutase-associated GTPase MeaB [Lapillicoccus sp.]